MVNNNFNKKGQAAIEFLMTYGWMLLVVLIVGALVFSFVDFGSLLPDKVDISTQSIRADSANSAAYSDKYDAVPADKNMIYVGFTYTGGQKGTISPIDATLTTDLSKKCFAVEVTNERLLTTQNITRNVDGSLNVTTGSAPEFLSGHPGTMKFECKGNVSGSSYANEVGALLGNDVIEGKISIGVKDVKRGTGARAIPNAGTFRISIQ